jgi:hypothetical protein
MERWGGKGCYDVRGLITTPSGVKQDLSTRGAGSAAVLQHPLGVVLHSATSAIMRPSQYLCYCPQVYMHHFVGATTFLVESGAEMRGRQQRTPVGATACASSHSLLENIR